MTKQQTATTDHAAKAQALADKIARKAADVLEPLIREMDIMKWPAEYRVIMWEAVACHATVLAAESK